MQTKYKMLLLDVDGVLIFDSNKIKQKIFISNLISQGINVSIVTGRSLISAKNICLQLGIKMPIITFNGSLIYEPISKKIIYQKTLSPLNLRKIIEISNSFSISPIFFTSSTIFANEHSKVVEDYCKKQEIDFKLSTLESLMRKDLIKMLFISDNENLISFKGSVQKIIGENHFFFTRNNYMELVSKKVSKYIATRHLCKELNIKINEIVAIGDQESDIEMLKKVGKGYSMPHSPKFVKDAVGLVAPEGDDFLQRLVEAHLC